MKPERDEQVEYQSGKVQGVFTVGSKIEGLKETYEQEIKNYEAMKAAFALAGRALEEYKTRMVQELLEARVPIKEAEIGKTYVSRCIDLIRTMFNDAEAKRLQAQGGATAIQQVVESAKRVYDEEKDRLKGFEEYSKQENKDLRERPTGYPPPAEAVQTEEKRTKKRAARSVKVEQ